MENGADHILNFGDKKKAGVKFEYLQKYYDGALEKFAVKHKEKSQDVKALLRSLLTSDTIMSLLIEIAQVKVFSHEIHEEFKDKLTELGALKQLKYFYAIPLGQLTSALAQLHVEMPTSQWWEGICKKVHDSEYCRWKTSEFLESEGISKNYKFFADTMEKHDPHAVYPTNIYRQCDGCTVTAEDFTTIESVMSTTLTTTIKVRKKVLEPSNETLSSIYKPLGRCVSIIDEKVAKIYGTELDLYFKYHNIEFKRLVYKGDEVDKEMENVEKILVDLKKHGVSRNEPVLIAGGGVISDIGGFACALYHRSTPYVMLCTSIVSGVDAGPSPRTCCDGYGYKNLYGAYHPPIQTITDRYFFQSLREGWLRHGIAEIIKMGVVKDRELFCLLEKAGPRLIRTKFATEIAVDDPEFESLCDAIVGHALDSYVKSEYGNLWETHQCRPHAYGHTWTPGYELSAGMLHGHAVASGMGYGAYLSYLENWITEDDLNRILKLISSMELTLWHPIMEEVDMIWASQVKIVQKRGGNLCAPVPKGAIGQCGYINSLPYETMKRSLADYREICKSYPRSGHGIEMHCADVGLQDPSVTAQHYVKLEQKANNKGEDKTSYAQWIQEVQTTRNSEWKFNVMFELASDTEHPPPFDHVNLFHGGVEDYAMSITSIPSDDVKRVAKATTEASMFAPCMVGTLESQFLKMQVSIAQARKILDVGTFTGMSALSMAEGIPFDDGKVVTLEFDDKYADVAEEVFRQSQVGNKIQLIRGNAADSMKRLLKNGEKFDIVFIDADKESYKIYYEIAMSGLLTDHGFIMADNALCALLYDADDERSQKLHEFNQHVKNDKRVEQTLLTMREGVSIIKPLRKK